MADSVDVDLDLASLAQLMAGLDRVREAPSDSGVVELIVARPAVNERLELASAELDIAHGLVADSWSRRDKPNPKSQVTVMNARAARLVAGDRSRWGLAGDQLYVDFDLSPTNIPPGTQLALGSVIIEVSDQPHLGCQKFSARFGEAARELANSPEGKALNLRGINTRVVRSGTIQVGDRIHKVR